MSISNFIIDKENNIKENYNNKIFSKIENIKDFLFFTPDNINYCISNPILDKGILKITDNKNYICINTNLKESGIIDKNLLFKTSNLKLSIINNDIENLKFPKKFPIKGINHKNINSKIFKKDLIKHEEFISNLTTNNSLCGILFDSLNKKIVSSNNYICMIENNLNINETFLISKNTMKILSTYLKLNEIIDKVELYKDEKTNINYLTFYGKGFLYTTKLLRNDYPDYINIIPENTYKIKGSLYIKEIIIKMIDKLYPIIKTEKNLIMLQNNIVKCFNREIKKYINLKLPISLTPEIIDENKYYCYDASLLKKIILNIDNNFNIYYSENELEGIIFKDNNKTFFIKPLQILKNIIDITKFNFESIQLDEDIYKTQINNFIL